MSTCSLLRECWDKNPAVRPTFEDIIRRLEEMLEHIQRSRWKARPMITGAVNTIVSDGLKYFQRVQNARSDPSPSNRLPRIDEAKPNSSRGARGQSRRGGSAFQGGESHRGGETVSLSEEAYPWLSADEGSVSTVGTSEDSSFSTSIHGPPP